MNDLATLETKAGIARIAINRPDKRNAMNPDVRRALMAAFGAALSDDAVRAIVLTGNGGTFCAGGDIASMEGLNPKTARARMKDNHTLVRLIAEAEKPVVAAVEGFAVGAGAGLALLADTIIVADGATIGFPFFKVGLIPDYALLFTLPRRVGDAAARQMLLYARNYDARSAVAIGLADEFAEKGEAELRAQERAAELAAMPPHAFGIAKRQLGLWPTSLGAALEMEAMGQSLSFNTDEHAEGRAAFREKRTPKFR